MRGHQRYTNYDILYRLIDHQFTNGHHAECVRDFVVLEDGFDTLLAALVNGYEVEKSAEELAEDASKAAHDRIRIVYQSRLSECQALVSARSIAFADGIKFTLNELGITISEVNA